MSASALGKMATMATMADVSVESLTGGLEKMMVTVGKAAGGDEEAKGPLAKLGLDARKLAAMAPEKQLNVIAAEIAKLPSRAERLAVISEVFGKGKREIIKFIENFDELRAVSERTGNFITDDQYKAIDEADRSLKELKATFDSIWKAVAADAAPAIKEFADGMSQFLQHSDALANVVGLFRLMGQATDTAADSLEMYTRGLDRLLPNLPGKDTAAGIVIRSMPGIRLIDAIQQEAR